MSKQKLPDSLFKNAYCSIWKLLSVIEFRYQDIFPVIIYNSNHLPWIIHINCAVKYTLLHDWVSEQIYLICQPTLIQHCFLVIKILFLQENILKRTKIFSQPTFGSSFLVFHSTILFMIVKPSYIFLSCLSVHYFLNQHLSSKRNKILNNWSIDLIESIVLE